MSSDSKQSSSLKTKGKLRITHSDLSITGAAAIHPLKEAYGVAHTVRIGTDRNPITFFSAQIRSSSFEDYCWRLARYL
ncbi:hypothetical protein HA466_0043220 [Hirschfeldia incana]|nr:hypothetical protein HA466_0043220 [Hirschfeldia incana]